MQILYLVLVLLISVELRLSQTAVFHKMKAKQVLTINYDLCLLGLCCVDAGDVAAVGSGVSDVDPVDGQDANSLCGMRQSFTIGLSFHPAVCLARRSSLKL